MDMYINMIQMVKHAKPCRIKHVMIEKVLAKYTAAYVLSIVPLCRGRMRASVGMFTTWIRTVLKHRLHMLDFFFAPQCSSERAQNFKWEDKLICPFPHCSQHLRCSQVMIKLCVLFKGEADTSPVIQSCTCDTCTTSLSSSSSPLSGGM